HAHNQTLYKKPLFNTLTDFAPVALVGDVPLVLITRKDLPPDTLQEFITYTRANQAKMQYGSARAGTSTPIGGVMLNQAIGAHVTHLPYPAGRPAHLDPT